MKVSAKARYGLRILLDLALFAGEKPRSIKDIAKSQQISEKFSSRLMIELRRAGLVSSVRGTQGGFRLARNPEQVTLLDVVETMEGPIHLLDCLGEPEVCPRHEHCSITRIWGEVNQTLVEKLSSITLQNVIDRYLEEHGSADAPNYCI